VGCQLKEVEEDHRRAGDSDQGRPLPLVMMTLRIMTGSDSSKISFHTVWIATFLRMVSPFRSQGQIQRWNIELP